MLGKSNVLPVVTDHYETLVDGRTSRRSLADIAAQVGFPIAVGAVCWWQGVQLREVGAALGGLAIFTGLLFGLVVFVFQLRIQAASDPRVGRGHRVIALIDELFKNVSYAVLVGLMATGAGMVANSTADPATGTSPWVSAVLVALSLHLLLVVFMCLKRTRAAYQRLTK